MKKPIEDGNGVPLKNPRWEAFALAYVELRGDAAKAYRKAYPASERWKDESVHTRASRLLNHAKVVPRISKIRERVSAEGIASAQEVGEYFSKVLRNDPSMQSPLLSRGGNPILHPDTGKPIMMGVPIRTAILAGRELNRMMGYNKPLKVKVEDNGSGKGELPDDEKPVRSLLAERLKALEDGTAEG